MGMPRGAVLDNIFWQALDGAHRQWSDGGASARRYTQGFSPIIAFADPAQADFAALAPYCASGEHFYCDSWSGAAPPGWRIEAESTMYRMVFDGALAAADPAPDASLLDARHAPQALELASLCKPGPFGIRTIELGDYFGYFEDGRLVAMAGERLRVPGWCEISGVCVHPGHQGRGLARKLIGKLLLRHAARGERSFLHVMRNNPAHQLYLDMGFQDYLETTVRVVAAE